MPHIDCPIIVLTKLRHFSSISPLCKRLLCVENIEDIVNSGSASLITFQTGAIVPKRVYEQFDPAINIHGGSPSYPGRDPHHWAAYDSSGVFGATAHFLSPTVDSGPIILTVTEPMGTIRTPAAYREAGERCSFQALRQIIELLNKRAVQPNGQSWERQPFRRSDLLAMCDFREINPKEIERRRAAFEGFEPHFVDGISR